MQFIDSTNNDACLDHVNYQDNSNEIQKEIKQQPKEIPSNTYDEHYYKEMFIVNFQRYRAMLDSMLINNIIIDERFEIIDLNKKAEQEFGTIIGIKPEVGNSFSDLLLKSGLGSVIDKLRQNRINETIEFEFTDRMEARHLFILEQLIFISPNLANPFKCISIIKTSKFRAD